MGIAPDATWFCKMDAVKGYHQVPLSAEASRLTTFLLPWGRFRYLRGPMGLSSTGDAWCQHSDHVIAGVPNSSKIVDDVLLTASSLEQLTTRIRTVLDRAREICLTISRRKFHIGREVNFAG